MNLIIDLNKIYKNNLTEQEIFATLKKIQTSLQNKKFKPIYLFQLDLTNGIKESKTKIEQIKKMKKTLKLNSNSQTAVKIIITKEDHKFIGLIENLRKEFDLIIGAGGLNKINRFFLERCNIDFLLDPQNSRIKPKIDFVHHFNSGLNHILCKIASEKEKSFIFSLNFFLWKNDYLISKEIGRITQNFKLAKKYKIEVYTNFIISKETDIKNLLTLRSYLSVFGITLKKNFVKEDILSKKIQQNKKIKEGKYLNKYISVKQI